MTSAVRRAQDGPVVECRRYRDSIGRLRLRPLARTPDDRFQLEARLAGDGLPLALRRALESFRARGNRRGYLLLRGLMGAPENEAESCLAAVGARLGELAGYAQERNGALFHDVAPLPGEAFQQSAAGSRAPLALHTERCFHPFLPSHVLLACVRPDPGGQAFTEIASGHEILARTPARWLAALQRPEFRTGIDYSFGNVATEKANGPVLSVLYGNPADPFLRYDLDLMVGLTPRARAALAAFTRAARLACTGIALAAGDLLVIDNRRAVHGRSAFVAGYDGRDRCLKRAYVVADLAAAAADCRPGEHVIRTRF